MKDCKVLYVVNFSLIAQQIYNKLVECTVEYFVRWFVVILWWSVVVCGSLQWFAVFQRTGAKRLVLSSLVSRRLTIDRRRYCSELYEAEVAQGTSLSAEYRQIEFHRRYICFHSVDLSTSYKEVYAYKGVDT